jgi:HEAT repeat protein
MRERSPTDRLQAVLALPEDPSSCQKLLEAARDPSLDVARQALRRLERIGSDAEAAVLRNRLFEVDIGIVPDYAATLHRLRDEASVEVALRRLGDDDMSVRAAACLVLREFAAPRARVPLTAALSDEMAAVRRVALEALARLGVDGQTASAAQALLHDSDPAVRRAAVAALAVIAPEPARVLTGIPADDDSSVRRALAAVSPALDDPTAALLLCDVEPEVRAETLGRLEQAPRASLLPLVRTTVDDPAWRVRRAAIRALRAAGDTVPAALLVSRLVDESSLVRAESRRTLVELFGRRLPEVVAAELAAGPASLRRTLVYVLGESCGADALAPIAEREHDPDPQVRIAVARTLAAIPSEQAREVVERLRSDPDASVRHAAALAAERR